MTTQTPGSTCIENLRLKIRDQINAFRVMASLNSNLSPDILVDNLEELLSKEEAEQQHAYAQQQQLSASNNTLTLPSNNNVEETNSEEKMNKKVDTNNFNITSAKKKKRRKRIDGAWQVWETRCRNLMENVWRHDDAYPFHHPVDSQQYPDYYHVIDRPMCLEKIQDNLVLGVYASPTDLHNDMLLMFSNSRIYNVDPASTISRMTQQLESFYQSKVKAILNDWKLNPEKLQLPDTHSQNNNNNSSDDGYKNDKKQVQTEVGANGNNFYRGNNKLPKRKKGNNNNNVNMVHGDYHFAKRSVPVEIAEEKVESPNAKDSQNPTANPFTAKKLRAADEALLTKHVDGRKVYECLMCHKSLTMQRNARLHVLRVHFRMRMPCSKCGQRFYDYKMLGIHVRKCSGIPAGRNGGEGIVTKDTNLSSSSAAASAQKNLNLIQKRKSEKQRLKKLRLEREKILQLAATTVVTNPCKNFNLIRALSVKVKLERLHLGGFRDDVPPAKKKRIKKRLEPRPDSSNGCEDSSSNFLVNENGNDPGVQTPSINSYLGDTSNSVPLYDDKNYSYYDNDYAEFGPLSSVASPFEMMPPTPSAYSVPNLIPPSQPFQVSQSRSSRHLVDDPSKSIVDLILHNLVEDDPQPMTTTVVNVTQRDFVDVESYYGYGQQQHQQQQQQQVPMHDQYLSEFLPATNQYDYSYPY